MPNQLKMSKIQSVLALRQQGWTFTRIANELGIHRETVAQYVRQHSKPTEAPPGSEGAKPTEAPTGSEASKSTDAPTGSADPKSTEAPRIAVADGSGRSDCAPFREVIESKLDQELHARRKPVTRDIHRPEKRSGKQTRLPVDEIRMRVHGIVAHDQHHPRIQ